MIRKLVAFILIFLPPVIILLVGIYFKIFVFDLAITGGVILGWVTFLAAVFQILGFDLKMFLASGNVRKRKTLETSDLPALDSVSANDIATVITEKEINQIIKDASEIFASPLILFHTLSPITDERSIKFSELKNILDCNVHILKSRIDKLQALGLISVFGESVKRTSKGKRVTEFLETRFVR